MLTSVVWSALYIASCGVRLAQLPSDPSDLDGLNLVSVNTSASVERLTEQLAELIRKTPVVCDACEGEFKWQFIVGPGRSGTTTAMMMIDEIPGYYVTGENKGLVNDLQEIFENTQSRLPSLTGALRRDGAISEQHLLCAMQDLVRLSLGSFDEEHTTTIGFKEIRFETTESMVFMQKLFPCAKYIVVTRRNPQLAVGSGWITEENIFQMINVSETLEAWQGQNADIAFPLQLEDFSLKRFNDMLTWLGVTGCEYTHIAHSNKHGNYSDGRSQVRMNGTCVFS
uniref:Protein-tyrosine sulfotransferase n=1 Tax=Noctiluca scintillans TaxID=2966 RepID=A0A7S1B1T8_NOCSC|mmetsp:Transcript_9518/g.26617  ORF Transcript_9518/g.26617 Transcript_9518/m.26617 type:complete len:283 (+) Transcript_9518:60-908(+)